MAVSKKTKAKRSSIKKKPTRVIARAKAKSVVKTSHAPVVVVQGSGGGGGGGSSSSSSNGGGYTYPYHQPYGTYIPQSPLVGPTGHAATGDGLLNKVGTAIQTIERGTKLAQSFTPVWQAAQAAANSFARYNNGSPDAGGTSSGTGGLGPGSTETPSPLGPNGMEPSPQVTTTGPTPAPQSGNLGSGLGGDGLSGPSVGGSLEGDNLFDGLLDNTYSFDPSEMSQWEAQKADAEFRRKMEERGGGGFNAGNVFGMNPSYSLPGLATLGAMTLAYSAKKTGGAVPSIMN